MITRISSIVTILAAAILANPEGGSAADVAQSNVPVAYGLLLDGKDAIYGQQVCHVHSPCQLIDDQKARVEVSVTIDSTQHLSGEVSIQCSEPDCSFLDESTSAKLENAVGGERSRQFELYAGDGVSHSNDLVYIKRTNMGRIFFFVGN
ncbi:MULTISPECIES: hypothetical protein [unclassified Rhizobium]|uniref:hypothetical protein n=1 Tax=unclassified Rhizobium TaxID=2613769 RepID=UPI000EA97DB7|nr:MULTISPECIES: hypothetical protein [unclassified Rhizobium]AYG66338.1 hypothetical protein CCGE531_10275 [Rhizobium sp. CCGE531]AYG72719.1 hypothetical protein CCGE532_09700 [Rhizobium sp. CCGE532]